MDGLGLPEDADSSPAPAPLAQMLGAPQAHPACAPNNLMGKATGVGLRCSRAQDRQTGREGGCPTFPELPQPGCPTTRPGPLRWSLSIAKVGPVPPSVAVTSGTTRAHPQSQRRCLEAWMDKGLSRERFPPFGSHFFLSQCLRQLFLETSTCLSQ